MADVRPITTLLVANRGEIARRIFRSAHAMGIATVAVYAESDAQSPFVSEADRAIALTGTTSAETYLNQAALLEACADARADAVHPGYGFLSENAGFAQAVVDAGMTWVGPDPQSIAQMGDKLAAKRIITEAEVPTLPARELSPGEDASALAEAIGYPVLVKASAGGGGRGMRVVEAPADLAGAVEGARREAESAFGDGTIFLERWVTSARHIEIQVLADRHGALVHLFERECSIQRRHQKIIEEAPSPAVGPHLRERMGEAAVRAAARIGYSNAGTVEFLLDGEAFWFLEMNTRLQVEHPVTEAITGLDLVREQLRIAEGEPLGYTQNDLAIDGHAIEARIYAENPLTDFLPAPGTIAHWAPAAGVRVDSGVASGSVVDVNFDPMIAKVISHAPTRREASAKLARALEATQIQGITNNRDFLVEVLRSPAFIAGDTTTDFIERIGPARGRTPTQQERRHAAAAAALFSQADHRRTTTTLAFLPSGWRNSHMPPERVRYLSGEDEVSLAYQRRRDGTFALTIDGESGHARVHAVSPDTIDLALDGRRGRYSVRQGDDSVVVHGPSGELTLHEVPRFPLAAQTEFSGGLVAPMPGKVLSTAVQAGDVVSEGQLLIVLEAMKMEHRITAPVDGQIARVEVAEGAQVENGQVLVVFAEDGENPCA